MTDFSLLLSRIQAVYSLEEIAGILGVDRIVLDRLKLGAVAKFPVGMRILALHDQVIGGGATASAIESAKVMNWEGLKVAVPKRTKTVEKAAVQKRVGGKFA